MHVPLPTTASINILLHFPEGFGPERRKKRGISILIIKSVKGEWAELWGWRVICVFMAVGEIIQMFFFFPSFASVALIKAEISPRCQRLCEKPFHSALGHREGALARYRSAVCFPLLPSHPALRNFPMRVAWVQKIAIGGELINYRKAGSAGDCI